MRARVCVCVYIYMCMHVILPPFVLGLHIDLSPKHWPAHGICLLIVVYVRTNRPNILLARLHCLHCCNTNARLLSNTRPPHPTPLVYAIHHAVLVMAISCKGQPKHSLYRQTRSCPHNRSSRTAQPILKVSMKNATSSLPALPMRIAPEHPASLTPTPTAVTA